MGSFVDGCFKKLGVRFTGAFMIRALLLGVYILGPLIVGNPNAPSSPATQNGRFLVLLDIIYIGTQKQYPIL